MSRERTRSVIVGCTYNRLAIDANAVGVVRESCVAAFPETKVRPGYQHRFCCWAVWQFRSMQLFGYAIEVHVLVNNQLTGSAAKLAQVGFTETLAKEGFKYNIICNVIAPIGTIRHPEHLIRRSILTEGQRQAE